jgi:hypothetical protein
VSKEFDRVAKRANAAAGDPEALAAPSHHPAGLTNDEHDQAVRRAARQAWDTLSMGEQADLIRERPQLAALCQTFLH